MLNDESYIKFVDGVTSKPSKDTEEMIRAIRKLEDQGINPARLMTGAIGLAGESGEIADVVKKLYFHGKPLTEENVIQLKKEVGDCLWYIAQLCMALNININDACELNVEKLSARYPEGFSTFRSENRKEGDV